MRSSLVVRKANFCWMAKIIRRTAESTNRTMIEGLFHAYSALPKLMAMMRHRIEAIERAAPRKSKFFARARRVVEGAGSNGGRRKM